MVSPPAEAFGRRQVSVEMEMSQQPDHFDNLILGSGQGGKLLGSGIWPDPGNGRRL